MKSFRTEVISEKTEERDNLNKFKISYMYLNAICY